METNEYVWTDLDIDALLKSLRPQTESGHTWLRERISQPITDADELARRQSELRHVRARLKGTEDARRVLAETESDVMTLATAKSDTRHNEYYQQVLWAAPNPLGLHRLNTSGWWNELVVVFRTLLQPALVVLMCVSVFLAPLLLAWLSGLPMTVETYMRLLPKMLAKSMPSVLGKPRFTGHGGVLETGERALHVGAAMVFLCFSVWTQVSSARSLRAVVADMRRRATSLQRSMEAVATLRRLLGLEFSKEEPWTCASDTLSAFGQAWNFPDRIRWHLLDVGELDGLLTLASLKRTAFPRVPLVPTVSLTDLWIPSTGQRPVYNSIVLDASAGYHVLLTGPNRGGKSTLLRAVGTAILMAQSYGIVFARAASLPLFGRFLSALQPSDRPGLSLFESEIEFARTVQTAIAGTPTGPKGHTFLLMDEIFHGTNAHDGVEAAQVFLDDLYRSPHPVFSLISTHYVELPTRYRDHGVQAQCMEASQVDGRDKIVYTYRMCAGINGLSSVREILRERGLLTSTTTPL